jgi:hypothetical protein
VVDEENLRARGAEGGKLIELRKDRLTFSFPDVHARAQASIEFQRTLRIPDDGRDYPLPPGLGRFPLCHVDDHASRVPPTWIRHGGVMLPMYQSEALWLNFNGHYPMAVKVAAGKIDAVTGEAWTEGLHRHPQDYVVVPDQPWLDGYCVERGTIRQFVAMPLGAGYTAEEQLTGSAEFGGVQLLVYPMKREVWEKRQRRAEHFVYSEDADARYSNLARSAGPSDMGLAPGGRMRQEIYDDPYDPDDWDVACSSRCFVHLANSLAWRAVTGTNPPTTPPTAEEYTRQGLPWFDYYGGDVEVLGGSSKLASLKSVFQMGKDKGDVPLPENQSVEPTNVVHLRQGLADGQVREGTF